MGWFTQGIFRPLMERKQHAPAELETIFPPSRRRRRRRKEPQVFVRSYKNTPCGDLQEFAISGYIVPEFLDCLRDSNLDHLTKVTLEGNFLDKCPTTFRRLLVVLPTDSLENLTLRWNGIDENGAYRLAQRLPKYRNLHSLSLSENQLGPKGLAYLMDVGQLYSLWDAVELWDCDLGDDGAGLLGSYLSRKDVEWKIRSLNLATNDITDRGAVLLATGLSRMRCDRLQSLDLSRNRIGNDGLIAIANAVSHSFLQKLSLHHNRFDAKGVTYLASLLKGGTLRSLLNLDLSNNSIRDTGVFWIAQALRSRLCCLEELFLSNTQISNSSVANLASALEKNQRLKRLALEGIHPGVTRQGARFFLHCLAEHNTTLSSLTLLGRTYDNHLVNDCLDNYLECNRCGWHHLGDVRIGPSTWPLILSKSKNNRDLLYKFLRRRPDLLLVK
jgi:Ran GTPase-activating protein (RanGAP) involved in mRNA processing and transport